MTKRVGQYQLKQELGRGVFGIVYQGKHTPSNADIAVKMIPRSRLTPETQAYLDQEISILRSVDSKHIMKLFDVQKTGSNFYMILEYCAGGDLGKFIKENGPVSEAVAKAWFSQLMEAFKCLHRKNIIHRDLKLANILLTEASTNADIKLGDFGLARYNNSGLASTYCGTPLNMAPEVFDHNKYDSKADIWSLGTVLYEMLYGRTPFNVQNAEELRNAQKRQLKFDGVSPACAELLTCMLKHDPAERISFEELFEASFLSFSKASSEDYEILKYSTDQFICLSPVKDPPKDFIDIEEERSMLTSKVAGAESVAAFAEKLLARQEQLSAVALFAKSALILNSVVEQCANIIAKHELSQSTDFEFFNDYETYKANFVSKAAQVAHLSEELDSYATNIEQYGAAGYAESLIYNYALSLGKEAAQDEYIRHFKRAYERYEECIQLLKAIEDNCDTNSLKEYSEGWQVLISVRQEAEKRFASVKLQCN